MWFLRVQGEDYRRGKREGSHTPVDPKGSADDGKRSEAEWTLCDDGIEERGVRLVKKKTFYNKVCHQVV